MDKIFVLDNFDFVPDKKYFVQADGQGTRRNSFVQDKIFFVQDKIFFVPDKIYFVLDKFDFVPDKKYFVRADGQGISLYFHGTN